jgi:hypothetical protein
VRRSQGGAGSTTESSTNNNEVEIDDAKTPLANAEEYRFEDVRADYWFYEAVNFVYTNDIMQGISSDLFAPNASLNRAMAATVLFRMAEAEADFVKVFDDVGSGQWYSEAITWAAEHNIVLGIGNGLFAPYESVTREQFATMLFRYAMFTGYDMSTSTLANFVDIDDVNDWALGSISWAVHQEIMQGVTGSRLNPLGTTTRAEVATILMRITTKLSAD